MKLPLLRRIRMIGQRTSHASKDIEAAKIIAEYRFFCDSISHLEGKIVVEIGFGDSIGLAPLLLSSGVKKYIGIDRFLGNVWDNRSLALYAKIADFHGPFAPDWRERVELQEMSIENAICHTPIADVIISFDAIEHFSDISSAVSNMVAMLKPGGIMIHRVDYGPHGVWLSTSCTSDFLRVPNIVWRLMGSNRGYPNRIRHNELLTYLIKSGLKISDRITKLQGEDVIDAEISAGIDFIPTLGRPFSL